jgi:hypothetical protein
MTTGVLTAAFCAATIQIVSALRSEKIDKITGP